MRYVLFDLDGTLVDSSEGIMRSFSYAFCKMNLSPPSMQELRSCIGPPLLESFLRFFNGDKVLAEKGVKFYRERYAVTGWKECKPFDNVIKCLQSLTKQGKVLALATGKPQCFAENILSFFGMNKYFTVVVGSNEDNSFDDKGKIIQRAMELLDAERKDTVMVGDRKYDAIGARQNGIAFIGLRLGFAAEGELEEHGATCFADDFSSLLSALL